MVSIRSGWWSCSTGSSPDCPPGTAPTSGQRPHSRSVRPRANGWTSKSGTGEPAEEPDEEVTVGTSTRDIDLLVEQQGRLIARIELISPRNKDRPSACTAYINVYAGYLLRGSTCCRLTFTGVPFHSLAPIESRRSWTWSSSLARHRLPSPTAWVSRRRAAASSLPSGDDTWRWVRLCRRCGCRSESGSRSRRPRCNVSPRDRCRLPQLSGARGIHCDLTISWDGHLPGTPGLLAGLPLAVRQLLVRGRRGCLAPAL
jgi:hypothetical protein